VDADNAFAEPIARFCGATGVLPRPLTAGELRRVLEQAAPLPPPSQESARAALPRQALLPRDLLRDLAGEVDQHLATSWRKSSSAPSASTIRWPA
jgi:hypothetical protein